MSLGACLGPMQEMGMNFKHHGTVDCRHNIEMPGFLILVNPKLVWNSWNLACYHGAASTCRGTNFVPFGAGLGIMLLTNRSFSQQAWWFSVGNVPPLGMKRYPLPLIAFKFFSHVNIEQQECCVIFCDFSGFVWTFFMHLLSFQCIYVHNSNLNYMHMLQCI